MIEGIARVVSVEGNAVWLEPEQSGSCGSCASSATCGTKGIGTAHAKLEARRFRIENTPHLVLGERVVVGISESSLLKAALAAYAIPLITMLATGVIAQWLYGRDAITILATLAGLAAGFWLMRFTANHMEQRGSLVPHYLRRARPGETCQTG